MGEIFIRKIRTDTIYVIPSFTMGFPGGSDPKESSYNAGDPGSIPGSGRSPWKREWLCTSVFLPGEFLGQKSLVGCSLWGCKESDTTEWLASLHFSFTMLIFSTSWYLRWNLRLAFQSCKKSQLLFISTLIFYNWRALLTPKVKCFLQLIWPAKESQDMAQNSSVLIFTSYSCG